MALKKQDQFCAPKTGEANSIFDWPIIASLLNRSPWCIILTLSESVVTLPKKRGFSMFDSVLGSPVCRSFKIPFLEKQSFLLNPPKETVGKLHLHCLADWSISVPSARDEIFTGLGCSERFTMKMFMFPVCLCLCDVIPKSRMLSGLCTI